MPTFERIRFACVHTPTHETEAVIHDARKEKQGKILQKNP